MLIFFFVFWHILARRLVTEVDDKPTWTPAKRMARTQSVAGS